MTKKETFKWVVQIIASIATAILTAMERPHAWGTNQKSVLELFQGALALFCGVILYYFAKQHLPRPMSSSMNFMG